MKTKAGLLKPFQLCEFVGLYPEECRGKDNTRANTFSCGKRRGVLMSDGYKVIYGTDAVDDNTL